MSISQVRPVGKNCDRHTVHSPYFAYRAMKTRLRNDRSWWTRLTTQRARSAQLRRRLAASRIHSTIWFQLSATRDATKIRGPHRGPRIFVACGDGEPAGFDCHLRVDHRSRAAVVLPKSHQDQEDLPFYEAACVNRDWPCRSVFQEHLKRLREYDRVVYGDAQHTDDEGRECVPAARLECQYGDGQENQ